MCMPSCFNARTAEVRSIKHWKTNEKHRKGPIGENHWKGPSSHQKGRWPPGRSRRTKLPFRLNPAPLSGRPRLATPPRPNQYFIFACIYNGLSIQSYENAVLFQRTQCFLQNSCNCFKKLKKRNVLQTMAILGVPDKGFKAIVCKALSFLNFMHQLHEFGKKHSVL